MGLSSNIYLEAVFLYIEVKYLILFTLKLSVGLFFFFFEFVLLKYILWLARNHTHTTISFVKQTSSEKGKKYDFLKNQFLCWFWYYPDAILPPRKSRIQGAKQARLLDERDRSVRVVARNA